MNKTELVAAMSRRANLTQRDTERALDAFLEVMSETLREGDKIQLVGYGTFEVRERAQRKGKNPQTGEEILIPATRVPVFKPGKILRDMIH